MNILCGHRGDLLDRALTARDLFEAGVINFRSGITKFDGSATLHWQVQIQLQYRKYKSLPTLTASGAFENILLTWTMPSYVGHAFFRCFDTPVTT